MIVERFEGRDIISMQDFSREELDFILDTATRMEPIAETGSDMLKGKILASSSRAHELG